MEKVEKSVPNVPIKNKNVDVGDQLHAIRLVYMINTLYVCVLLIVRGISIITFFLRGNYLVF